MVKSQAAEPGSPAGAQTLARGLAALEMVAAAENGMTVQEAADRLGVHRTIASRMLGTLAQHWHHRIARDVGCLPLPGRQRADRARAAVRAGAQGGGKRRPAPPRRQGRRDRARHGARRRLGRRGGCRRVPHGLVAHLVYRPGHRSPLDRGAAAYALRLPAPARSRGEPPGVARARRDKYAIAHGRRLTRRGLRSRGPHPARAGRALPPASCLITVDRQLAGLCPPTGHRRGPPDLRPPCLKIQEHRDAPAVLIAPSGVP